MSNAQDLFTDVAQHCTEEVVLQLTGIGFIRATTLPRYTTTPANLSAKISLHAEGSEAVEAQG